MIKAYRIIIIVTILVAATALPALHFARWSTSMGTFTAELYDQQTPITANNFISLANSGFYNNLIFHRVIEGFVIQDGCPYGTGYGGPGYTIPDEIYPGFHHDQAGILAMAKTSAPNSAGSQYYITLAPQPSLNGHYAIFGKVVQGLDVVMSIGSVPTDANDRPVTPVDIDTLRILDLAIGNSTPPDSTTYYCQVGESQMFIIEAESQSYMISYEWFVDGILQTGSDFIFETVFQSPGTHTVTCTVSDSDWSHDVVWSVLSEGSGVDEATPPVSAVLEVFPNPIHGNTSIRLVTNNNEPYKIAIFDLRGRLVRYYKEAVRNGGELVWEAENSLGENIASGVYIIRAQSTRHSILKRCVVF